VEYLNQLNTVQRQAVTETQGPALVIAGAGSGKTRVLTYRIAHLLNNGVYPSSVLSLTFTNKAAREMKERISEIVGAETAKYLWMGTFHSIFSRILRTEAEHIGYSSKFTIYDSSDSKSLLKSIIKELNLDEAVYKVGSVLGRISSAKNNLVTPEAYFANTALQTEDAGMRMPKIVDIYRKYSAKLKFSDAMDFDDLLLNTNILFRDCPQVLADYQKRFKYIMVDEYQDTNFSQYLIVKKLSALHGNVCVVGDDAQSIYSFRGAKIENILNFKNDYPNYQLFKLEQNYRSTQTIVNAANSIIAKNSKQIQKKVFSENEVGEKIKVVGTLTDKEEGFVVSSAIHNNIYTDGFDYSEIAILYRTNAQSRIFEETLRRKEIPYRLYGGLSFYDRKEIKDLLAYYKLIINHRDIEAFKRVINYPVRGIGKTTLDRLIDFSNHANVHVWDVLENIEVTEIGFNKGTVAKLKGFVDIIKSFSEKLETTNAYDLALEVADKTGILKEFFSQKTPENIARYENVQELLNGIKDHEESNRSDDMPIVTLDNYMENVSLLTDLDNEDPEDKNKVTLMTVHSSKGLEFKVVYLVGLEEDLFPSKMSAIMPDDVEEERRLFYVAITRAEVKAHISYAETRYKYGTPTPSRPSRFIKEIDRDFLDIKDDNESGFGGESNFSQFNTGSGPSYGSFKKRNVADNKPKIKVHNDLPLSQRNLKKIDNSVNNNTVTSSGLYNVGQKVNHEKFGRGIIESIEGEDSNIKAKIIFDSSGAKTLLLKFAKLEIIPS